MIVVAVVQINVIVVDLERSRGFYERLGMEFRPRNRRGEGPAEAWVSTNTGATVVLHSPDFASWWDETAPQPSVGGPQVDLELESVQRLDDVIAGLDAVGVTIIKRPTDMPWGSASRSCLTPTGTESD